MNFYKRLNKIIILIIFLAIFVFTLAPKNNSTVLALGFDEGNLISDGVFVNINAMNTADIQSFLEQKNSYLVHFSENGRSAAQIIYDASHGYGEASGSANGIDINSSTGTVNPQVLLVTLQKEQSLITETDRNDRVLDCAMGYGASPTCQWMFDNRPQFKGFTNQVEWAAWQLRYNYERAEGHGFSDYQVGQTMTFSNTGRGDTVVRLGNRATASLYRYTPHTYNGNYNFWYFFDQWFVQPRFSASWAGQNGNAELFPGESYQFNLVLKNTGTETWRKGQLNLGTDNGRDRISSFIREGDGPSGWIAGNRIIMVEDSVAPGDNATFRFWMKVPSNMPSGTYREYFNPVADGVDWLNNLGIYWDIRVKSDADKYLHSLPFQNAYPTLDRNQSYNFSLNVRNTGNVTWYKGRVNLGPDRPRDRITGFVREGNGPSGWLYYNRIHMQQDSVAPGETATFSFWMTVPPGMSSGTYREYFRLVADGITWMEDYGIYWDIVVR